MPKPTRPVDGGAGKFDWHTWIHDAVVPPIPDGSTVETWHDAHDHTAALGTAVWGDLSDVDTATVPPQAGDTAVFDGANWVPSNLDVASDGLLAQTGTGGLELVGRDTYNQYGLLAAVQYGPASSTNYDTSSTIYSDVDATNLAVTFTAPASGVVIVYLEGLVKTSNGAYAQQWNLRDASGDITGTRMWITRDTAPHRVRASVAVPGLTPGNEYTWKWGYRINNASGTATISIDQGSNFGWASMEVHAAPAAA